MQKTGFIKESIFLYSCTQKTEYSINGISDILLKKLFSTCELWPLGDAYQISWILDIYITIYNSSKITVIKEQKNNFMVGVTEELYKASQH